MMMRYNNGLDPYVFIIDIYCMSQYRDISIYQHTSLKSKLTGVQNLDELTLPEEESAQYET